MRICQTRIVADDSEEVPWEELSLFDSEPTQLTKRPRKRRSTRGSADPREFGEWTLDKLEILGRYFKVYRRVAGSGTFLDAFAGEGVAAISGSLVPSSTLIALESGAFRRLISIELKPELADRLRQETAKHPKGANCTVLTGDCNLTIVGKVLPEGLIAKERPCFAFLDPDSTQLSWSTVEALAAFKTSSGDQRSCKIELWILFNEHQAIRRLWPRDKSNLPQHASVLDRVMGSRSSWIDLWTEGRGPQWLVRRYCDQLTDLGYTHVHMQKIVDPASGRQQYWMIHATDHDAAVRFMKWAKRKSGFVMHNEPLPGFSEL